MSFCYQPLNPRTDFCMTYLNEDQLLPSESGVHHFLFLYRQSNAVGGLTRERRAANLEFDQLQTSSFVYDLLTLH